MTGHKIGGIKGAGAPAVRDPEGVLPLIAGGGQEQDDAVEQSLFLRLRH